MLPVKALLTGLAGVSLCMANISGIVTDTGATPVAGAIVQLEKGGQTATSGADGRFTLAEGSAILHGKSISLPNGLSAGIAGNLMTVTIAERAVVEVEAFDLNGKATSNIRQTMEMGVHTIALSQRRAGVYLYKVKSGNREFVLKGSVIGGVSSGSSVFSQGSSSKSFAKQAMKAAAINDVIAVTKTGYLNYRVVVYNSDTSNIQIKMIVCADTVRDIDGNLYQAVRIGNQVWMAENLRVTRYRDGSAVPFVTDSAAWSHIWDNNLTTPAYCYYNNMTDADSIKTYGTLYNWYVVCSANPRKIAPTGWHVPSDSEWIVLEKHLVFNGYNCDGTADTARQNKIAKSLATKTDWLTSSITGTIGCDFVKNNRSGFSALPGGCRDIEGTFSYLSSYGGWWSTTEDDASAAWYRYLSYVTDDLTRHRYYKGGGFSVRLLRDN